MRFPEGKQRVVTLSYDDGVEQDVKLLEIANKYGLKGTFNLNSGCYPPEGHKWPEGMIHRRMPKSEVTAFYKDCGWEVAAHGYTHPGLVGMPTNVCAMEILRDRQELEEQFGVPVRGFAYPFGGYDDQVVQILKDCGICYARTVGATHDFTLPKDWLRLDATCHHNDPDLMKLAQQFIDQKNWWDPRFFYLWGHSYEFEAMNNWNVFEEFAEFIGGRDDVWYATNIEIYDYRQAFLRLIFDADCTMCFNPSAQDVWFAYGDKEYVVKGGEKITL